MVVIRLARTGAKKAPFYHVVVADSRRSRGGRFIEKVGYYNPMARGQEDHLILEQGRIDHWVKQGAQPSLRVSHLIKMLKAAGGKLDAGKSKLDTKREQMQASQKAAAKKAKDEADAAKAAEEAEKKTAEAEASSADAAEKSEDK